MAEENVQGPDSRGFADRLPVEFTLDCGELIGGHRVLLTGLSDDGRSRSDLTSREQQLECQMVSLEYSLVPGGRPDEAVEGFVERFVLLAEYHADVRLPWTTAGFNGIGPGGLELFEGGERTNDTLGPWPVPERAQRLTFVLHRPPSSQVDPHTPALGTLVVDLGMRDARWESA